MVFSLCLFVFAMNKFHFCGLQNRKRLSRQPKLFFLINHTNIDQTKSMKKKWTTLDGSNWVFAKDTQYSKLWQKIACFIFCHLLLKPFMFERCVIYCFWDFVCFVGFSMYSINNISINFFCCFVFFVCHVWICVIQQPGVRGCVKCLNVAKMVHPMTQTNKKTHTHKKVKTTATNIIFGKTKPLKW